MHSFHQLYAEEILPIYVYPYLLLCRNMIYDALTSILVFIIFCILNLVHPYLALINTKLMCCDFHFCSGYLAPEYALGGQLTMKADVYSFGILILEIISGKSSARANWGGTQKFLLEWVSFPRT